MSIPRRAVLTGGLLAGAALPPVPPARIGGRAPPMTVATREAAERRAFPADLPSIRTLGHDEPGDGGAALYRRVRRPPAHAGWFVSADGATWELAEAKVSPEMLGGGETGLARALQIAATGRPVRLSGLYRLTAPITVTARARMTIEVTDGCVISWASAAATNWMLYILSEGHSVTVRGAGRQGLVLDGRTLAAKGLEVRNARAGVRADCRISGLTARNFRTRAATRGLGSSGLRVIGGFRTVELRGLRLETIGRDAGTGAPAAQGSQALVISDLASGNARHIHIADVVLDTVDTDDADGSPLAYDCDGIVVFQAAEGGATCLIENVTSRNCKGRIVKCASPNAPVVRRVSGYRDIPGVTDGTYEIAMLHGLGTVSGFRMAYAGPAHARGTVPVSFYTAAQAAGSFRKTVEDVEILDASEGEALISAIVDLSYNLTDDVPHVVTMDRVRMTGKATRAVIRTGSLGTFAPAALSLSDVEAEIAVGVCEDNGRPALLTAVLRNVVNTGAVVPVITRTVGDHGDVWGQWRDGGGCRGIARHGGQRAGRPGFVRGLTPG